MDKFDVVVIGGGPAGCKTAEHIAKKGYRVLVVEEHPTIGKPLQCAGLISPRTLQAAGVSEDIVRNQIRGAVVHAPGGEELVIRGKKSYALVIDRPLFDQALSARAHNMGAQIKSGTRAEVGQFQDLGVSIGLKSGPKETSVLTKLLIGADGANSRIAHHMGLPIVENHALMSAAEIEVDCEESDLAHIFLGKEVAPGWFGWFIPVDKKHARIGTGVYKGAEMKMRTKHPLAYLNMMIKAYPNIFRSIKITRYTGGFVPIGSPSMMYGERTLLVGDAACQVKPVSGGGIYLGMIGADLCAQAAVDALSAANYSALYLARYQKAWEEEMSAETRTALRHREAFLNFSDWEMNNFINFFNQPFWQNIILKYGDIDYISRLAGKLSLVSPWANKFMSTGLKIFSAVAKIKLVVGEGETDEEHSSYSSL